MPKTKQNKSLSYILIRVFIVVLCAAMLALDYIPIQYVKDGVRNVCLGMVDAMVDLIPSAKIGHIGLYRDPVTHEPVEYYCKLPEDIGNRVTFVVDPMLATGGSAVAAIDFLKKRGAKDIIMMNVIGCPEGIKRVQEAHPDVEMYLAACDEKLNDHAYIVPGLGDAGDRIFGTK